MPLSTYEYAIVRVVPRVERQEFFNAGVIVFCREQKFLAARVHFDETRFRALVASRDCATARDYVELIPKICAGGEAAGVYGKLSQAERFHFLVSPSSHLVQASAVHAGICEDPAPLVDMLFEYYVV